MSSKELPWDRLATTDSKGNRIYLYLTDTHGRWKTRRSQLSIFLILLFLGLPWVKIGGHQALLLDILNRRFAIFGLTFWAHDAPLLFFILGGAVILIAFITAIWGRVWCGWACPQTVFVEQVFRRVERWIEGDALDRKRLDESSFSFYKARKKFSKWFIFFLLALIISHSLLAYFIGTEALEQMIKSSPAENPGAFLLMLGVALGIFFDFAWFREQFCTIVCPYGRFQSVLMDNQSTVVAYDVKRGEPRRGSASSNQPSGDCVNCYRCVQVCPTGIDIRRGVQLECIACTACMDACDDVMSRLKKPLGLIKYGQLGLYDQSLNPSTSVGSAGVSLKPQPSVALSVSVVSEPTAYLPWFMRVRAWVYLGLLVVCIGGLILTVQKRAPIELTLIRAIDFPYQVIPAPHGETQVLNHFKLELRNQTFEEQEISFSINSELQSKGVSLVVSNHKPKLGPGEPERADLFVQFPASLLRMGHAQLPIQLKAESRAQSKGQAPRQLSDLQAEPSTVIISTQEASLVGPLR